MQTIHHISLAGKSTVCRKLAAADLLLGGRALTSKIVHAEVPHCCHPLGKHNKLVFAVGPLAGTLVSSANRLSVGAKSPLTGGIKESNAGGVVAYKLGRLGIRAMVIEEAVPKQDGWIVLHVSAAGVVWESGSELVGKGVYEKARMLFARYGKDAGLALIGPGGEQRLVCAGIACNDPEGAPARYCGRGGLGAVMASKGIQAVVVDDSAAKKEEYADTSFFLKTMKEVARLISSTPVTAEVFRYYGTVAMMGTTNSIGALPVRNFSAGTFELVHKIDGNALHDTIKARGGEGAVSHACMRGCIIQCSNVYPDLAGKTLVSPLEYENLGLLGPNCGIGDLDAIARLNYLCNDMGVDTIDVGAALAVAMEAGLAPFGDVAFAASAIAGIANGQILSKLIGSGAAVTGKVLGAYRVPAVKGQAMAAYDPRAIKGTGVTYATSPQGADHTAGNTPRLPVKHHEKEGQVENSQNAQKSATFMDAMGLCMMLGGAVKDHNLIISLINARFGTAFTLDEARAIAWETLQTEWDFNEKAGVSKAHDRLAEFFYEEMNPDSKSIFDLSDEDLARIRE